jgi:hypothetical protein
VNLSLNVVRARKRLKLVDGVEHLELPAAVAMPVPQPALNTNAVSTLRTRPSGVGTLTGSRAELHGFDGVMLASPKGPKRQSGQLLGLVTKSVH